MFQISYEQLPCLSTQRISNDYLNISPDDLKRPFKVVTKNCGHLKQKGSDTLEDAMRIIESGRPYACFCGQQARTIQELAQDLYGAIGIQFNESVHKVLMLQGIICHSYIRAKKYQDTLNKFQHHGNQSIIPDMLQRYNQQFSILNLLEQIRITGIQIYNYWAYCLLDKVKINIPVRIIGCNHIECYELTNLLVKQEQYQNETNQKFPCEYDECPNYLDMTSLFTVTSKLMIDKELLKILNQSPQTQFKFQYDFTSGQFMKYNLKDEFISKYLEIYAKDKLQDQILYQQIQLHIASILNEVGDTAPKPDQKSIKSLLNQQKYMVRQINLIDPFTQQTIEFPIRCIYCTDYTKCIDVRTLVTDYEIKNSKIYKCPLCNATIDISKSRTARYLKGYFYLDQNLLSKMFKDQQNTNQKSFNYNGKQYMLEEFMYKNKFSKDNYLKQLIQQSPNLIAEFKNLICINQPQKQLKHPLIIISCPEDNLVDFDSFYEKFQQKNYNIETDGIILCRCDLCIYAPIRKYQTELFYHEALGFALQNSVIPQTPGAVLKFDFIKGQQFMPIGRAQTIKNESLQKRQITSNINYQNLFKSLKNQRYFGLEVMKIHVKFSNNLEVDCTENNYQVNFPMQCSSQIPNCGFIVKKISIDTLSNQFQ